MVISFQNWSIANQSYNALSTFNAVTIYQNIHVSTWIVKFYRCPHFNKNYLMNAFFLWIYLLWDWKPLSQFSRCWSKVGSQKVKNILLNIVRSSCKKGNDRFGKWDMLGPGKSYACLHGFICNFWNCTRKKKYVFASNYLFLTKVETYFKYVIYHVLLDSSIVACAKYFSTYWSERF